MRHPIRLGLILSVLAGPVFAQSVPNGVIQAGQPPWTIAQWNSAWESKLDVTNVSGGGSTGSTFNTTFPSTGAAIGVNNGGNMVYVRGDAFNNLDVDLQTSLPSGSNVIGGVTQSGSWNVGVTGILPLPVGAASQIWQGGVYNVSPPALLDGQQSRLQLDPSGNLKVIVVSGGGGGGGGGTSSLFGSTYPLSGTAIGGYYAGNMVAIGSDSLSNLNVDLQTALPAGANVIGGVTQSGSWTVNNSSQGSASGGTAGTQSTLMGGVYNLSAPTLANGQQASIQLDAAGNVKANVVAGLVANFASTFPTMGTAIGAKNGANMVNLTADGSNNLNINCVVGCSGGTTSNASSGVATSSTNGTQVAFGYAFNGTTWDQLQDDASKNLKVIVNAALPAGSNAIGGVTEFRHMEYHQC